jgi:hypothetical protein
MYFLNTEAVGSAVYYYVKLSAHLKLKKWLEFGLTPVSQMSGTAIVGFEHVETSKCWSQFVYLLCRRLLIGGGSRTYPV